MKTATIDQILTPVELVRARELFAEYRNTGLFAKLVADELIKPNIDRINTELGQKNDPKYLAYAVEHILNEMQRRG